MARKGNRTERYGPESRSNVGRRDNSPGRRRYDHDLRTSLSRKALVAVIVISQAVYLAGDALLFGHNNCP